MTHLNPHLRSTTLVQLNKPVSRRKIHFCYFACTQTIRLGLSELSQSSDGGSDGVGGSSGDGVSATGNGLLAGGTSPDTNGTSSNGGLSAEGAVVSGVLLDFQLLTLSSQRRTVSDTVLTGDSNLLSSLSPGVSKSKRAKVVPKALVLWHSSVHSSGTNTLVVFASV